MQGQDRSKILIWQPGPTARMVKLAIVRPKIGSLVCSNVIMIASVILESLFILKMYQENFYASRSWKLLS